MCMDKDLNAIVVNTKGLRFQAASYLLGLGRITFSHAGKDCDLETYHALFRVQDGP